MMNKLSLLFPVICVLFLPMLCSASSWAKDGKEFLEQNKARPRVVTLKSGLQYKELIKGSGKKPTKYSNVDVYYTGKLFDGTEFDSSSITRPPITLNVNRVIAGWTEALQLMPEGSMWEIYVPSALGYGYRGSGKKIPRNSVLIFEIQLVKVH